MNTTPLDTLIELAERRCDDAARLVAREIAAHRSVEQKTRVLEQYRAEYVTRQPSGAKGDTDTTTLRNFSGFLDKLDDAVAQAVRETSDCMARLSRAQAAWNDAKRTLEGYEALARRNADRAALRERRVEQRQQDEFAARSARLHGGLTR